MNRDRLGRVFARKSPSAGWRVLYDWFLPKTMAEQVKWSVAFDDATMENGEEPPNILIELTRLLECSLR